MPKYGCLVVEGPHDVEFVYRLLSPYGLKRVQFESDLDPFFHPLIPRTFPPDGDLQKRVPVPLFLKSPTHVVAIHGAVGDSRLVQTLEEDAVLLDLTRLTGIGVLFDSDSVETPVGRYAKIRDRLREKGVHLPDDPGVVSTSSPRLGGFVLPDNHMSGTLENILIECAHFVYPTLLAAATAYIDSAVADISLRMEDLREIHGPAGRNKAIIGSIANVLRPGRAVQVSLQDNRWLKEKALEIPRVREIQSFLANILEIP